MRKKEEERKEKMMRLLLSHIGKDRKLKYLEGIYIRPICVSPYAECQLGTLIN